MTDSNSLKPGFSWSITFGNVITMVGMAAAVTAAYYDLKGSQDRLQNDLNFYTRTHLDFQKAIDALHAWQERFTSEANVLREQVANRLIVIETKQGAMLAEKFPEVIQRFDRLEANLRQAQEMIQQLREQRGGPPRGDVFPNGVDRPRR